MATHDPNKHDPKDRETCADYLRDLADEVEEGRVEAIWVVTTTAANFPPVNGHLSLLGPTHDGVALAKLFFMVDRLKHTLFNSLVGDDRFVVTNDKTGPRDEGGE